MFCLRELAFPFYFCDFSLTQRTSLCQEAVQNHWNHADRSAMELQKMLASIVKAGKHKA